MVKRGTARNSSRKPVLLNELAQGLFPGRICPGLIEAVTAEGRSPSQLEDSLRISGADLPRPH